MPLFYTHIRYANKCIELLSDEYKKIIENNSVYYFYGAQGPNIYNYHSPLTNKKYNKLSESIHNNSIANTLKNIKYEFNNNKDRDAILAYTLGYITHFVLDSYINSYLIRSSESSNTSINYLKNEIEKYYINKDKINIQDIIRKYKISNNLISIISKLLKTKEPIIKQSLSNMVQYSNIIYIKNTKFLKFINKTFNILKLDKYNSIFVNGVLIKNIAQVLRFEKYFEISKYHCQILFNNFIDYIFGDSQLDSYFFNTFYLLDKSPILDFTEEKQYIINDINR